MIYLLHRERGGSRIPRPSGWGWSGPSPGFHIFLDLINKDSLGTENKVTIILTKGIWSTKARRVQDSIKPGVRACGPKHIPSL